MLKTHVYLHGNQSKGAKTQLVKSKVSMFLSVYSFNT